MSIIANAGAGVPPSQTATTAYKSSSVQRMYQVILEVTGDDTIDQSVFPIYANLPERFNMDMSSSWDTPFAKTDAGAFAENLTKGRVNASFTNDALGVSGVSTRKKEQSANVWQGSSPLQFNIDLVFRANTNSQTEVRKKHKALMQLMAPSEKGGILLSPGPTVIDAIKKSFGGSGRSITLSIGNYLKLKDVIITNVSADVTCMFTKDGIPTNMTINIGVQSFYSSFTVQDIEEMFKISEGNNVDTR